MLANRLTHSSLTVRTLCRPLQQFVGFCKRVTNIRSLSASVYLCLSNLCTNVQRGFILLKQTVITTYKQYVMSCVSGLSGLLHLVYHMCTLGVCVNIHTKTQTRFPRKRVKRGQNTLRLTFPYWWDKASSLRVSECACAVSWQVLPHTCF